MKHLLSRVPFLLRNNRKLPDNKWQRRATIGTLILAAMSICTGIMTYVSNNRAEKIFGGQIVPWVQAKPIKFEMERHPKLQSFGTTTLSIINYTNFNACNVRIDIMYQNVVWIREWMQAKVNDFNKKKGRVLNKEEASEYELYKHYLKINEGENLIVDKSVPCKSGNYTSNKKTKEVSDALYGLPIATGSHNTLNLSETGTTQELTRVWKGVWDSQCEPCAKDDRCIVAIRTMWENEKGRQFESIDYYNLKCTKWGEGESFTFIPMKLSLTVEKRNIIQTYSPLD